MIEFGPAAFSDIPALCDLLALLFAQEAEFTPERAAQERGVTAIMQDGQKGHFLVARRNGRAIAMVSLLYTVSTALGARVAWLEDMVVEPSERGGGIGGGLLAFAVEFAKDQGCRRLTLLTDQDNVQAQRFYQRQGFGGSAMRPMRLVF